MFRTHREYLEYYHDKYKFNFKVYRHLLSEFPYRWINYNTEEYEKFIKEHGYVNHREVMPDEIIGDIDIDSENITKQKRNKRVNNFLEIIEKRLQILFNCNYELYESGGDGGKHFHTFYPELMEYNRMERTLIKQEFLKMLGYKYLAKNVEIGYPYLEVSDWTTITLEKSRNRKGGIKKFIRLNVSRYSDNKLPQAVIDKAMERKERYLNYEFKYDGKKPKEITLLESEDFVNGKDGRKRALFVLTCYYCFINKDDKEVFAILNEWNKYRLHNYFTTRQLMYHVNYYRKRNYKAPPIRYARDLLEEIGLI